MSFLKTHCIILSRMTHWKGLCRVAQRERISCFPIVVCMKKMDVRMCVVGLCPHGADSLQWTVRSFTRGAINSFVASWSCIRSQVRGPADPRHSREFSQYHVRNCYLVPERHTSKVDCSCLHPGGRSFAAPLSVLYRIKVGHSMDMFSMYDCSLFFEKPSLYVMCSPVLDRHEQYRQVAGQMRGD